MPTLPSQNGMIGGSILMNKYFLGFKFCPPAAGGASSPPHPLTWLCIGLFSSVLGPLLTSLLAHKLFSGRQLGLETHLVVSGYDTRVGLRAQSW